jgi:hypothetical protein
VIQRSELEELVGSLSESQWDLLEGSDLLRDAGVGLVTLEQLAARVREDLSLDGKPRPGERVIRREELGAEREQVLSLLLAIEAGQEEGVRAFRKEKLRGRLLPREAVDGWIRRRRLEPTVWVRVAVPQGRLRATEDGIRIRPALTSAESKVGYFEYMTLGYIDDHNDIQRVRTTDGETLEQLRVLGKSLADNYGWTAPQATTFVLTDAVPLLDEIRVSGRSSSRPVTNRIFLEIDPNARPERVAHAYAEKRKEMLPKRPRPLSDKSLALARYLAEADAAQPWRDRLESWNRAYPNWAYKPENVQNFHRDARAAQRRLLAGQLIVPGNPRKEE